MFLLHLELGESARLIEQLNINSFRNFFGRMKPYALSNVSPLLVEL
jgi:hypothetical protein